MFLYLDRFKQLVCLGLSPARIRGRVVTGDIRTGRVASSLIDLLDTSSTCKLLNITVLMARGHSYVD